MRLCKLLTKRFPDDAEVKALMSLMCFHAARFDSRMDKKGAMVLLTNQKRDTWNKELIASGHYYLSEACMDGVALSTYHLEANIAAIYCRKENLKMSDWLMLSKLYTWLHLHKPAPIIKISLAILESEISSPNKTIDMLNHLENEEKSISKYHLFYATRAHFHQKLNNHSVAISDYRRALGLTGTDTERDLSWKK